MRRLVALALALAGLASPGLAEERAWPRPAEGCVECHALFPLPSVSRPIRQATADVHGRAGVGCADCHGGDPTVSRPAEKAHDPARGFLPVARLRESIVERCGGCHMGPRHEYEAGRHAPAEGKKVPDCVGCHYADHLTLTRVEDIAVKARCGACHPPAVVLDFRRAFEEAEPALARARALATDPIAAREAARGSGLTAEAFEVAAADLESARVRFRDASHRADPAVLEESGDELETRFAALDPARREPDPTRAREPLYAYLVAGALVLGAIAYLAASRRLE